MEPDMIIVLGLATLFFGGIVYLILKDRSSERSGAAENTMPSQKNSQPPGKVRNR